MDPNANPSKPQPSRRTGQKARKWKVVDRLTLGNPAAVLIPTNPNCPARVYLKKGFRKALKLNPPTKAKRLHATIVQARRAIHLSPDPTTALIASLDYMLSLGRA